MSDDDKQDDPGAPEEVSEKSTDVKVVSNGPDSKASRSEAPAGKAQPGDGKTVALALGSGGARGYAHIGAIEVLQERGYRITAISGCSMGAVIGGMYAAGKMQDYKDWVTGLGQLDVLKLLDVTFSAVGAIRGEKVFSVVREILGDIRIEDLPIAYTAVATDLLAHKEIWFQEGPLDRAIRASIAIPGLVTPLILGNRVLVDGALLNPLPIIPTISAHADMVVAVNLAGEDDGMRRLPDAVFGEQSGAADDMENRLGAIRDKASHWFDWDSLKSLAARKPGNGDNAEDRISQEVARQAQEKQKAQADDKPAAGKLETIGWDKLGIGKFDAMNLAIETMQSALVQYKIAGYPPDLLVNVPKNVSRSYDYHKAPELIQLGRDRMSESLDRFEKKHSSSGPLSL
ncbi:patatin-like phospholipase family protein [Marinobacter persicus]|uniref:NTE family protein n=1 Tax=Marinobacter persicus TaxID=930118 RepID=A0A2S6G5C0_9GAMM|nr:patatin-like phospholipase family protein [Marinobacter persicus]PPK51031.1 NTE family protein [Marinobacter persicus]PPK54332.1 NTE family protein [Marinobacter persicus]PPK57549.1 NTE family protein [Marinobacter persicus]